MTTADQANTSRENRSENLLPPEGGEDGRFDVAEEVNSDQQSDEARRVGKPPEGAASDALAETLKDNGKK